MLSADVITFYGQLVTEKVEEIGGRGRGVYVGGVSLVETVTQGREYPLPVVRKTRTSTVS